MSYSLTIPVGDKANVAETIGDETDRYLTEQVGENDEHRPAIKDHLAAVRTAVTALVGAVGRPNDEVTVSVSGHANVDHAPADGWADETITVTVALAQAQDVLASWPEAAAGDHEDDEPDDEPELGPDPETGFEPAPAP